MSDNLLRIGSSAVLASSTLLNTTSNNIANINTEGYVRQRTEFEAQILGLGVGKGTTERLVNEFTLKQLRRDTSAYAFSRQYLDEANRVDALFSNPANSIATGMNQLFDQFQIANNDPTTLANRQLIIGSSEALLDRFNTMSTLVLDQDLFINQQLDIYVAETNGYIKQIAQLNKEIASYGTGASRPIPLNLLDKRDEAIRKLSEMVEIRTLDAKNGEKLVFMSTGQSLVVENGDFSLLAARGNPDPSRKELKLRYSANSNVVLDINTKKLGGKIGALIAFREEILDPTQNKLGQVALSLADALNEQNKLGMNLNGELGGPLFTFPTFNGFPYQGNSAGASLTGTVEAGQGSKIPPNDLRVTILSATEVQVQAVDVKGNVIAGSEVIATVAGFPATISAEDTAAGDLYGFTFEIDGAVGDQFEFKPLATAARQVAMATTRPEDIALASPIRIDQTLENLGNGKVEGLKITNTTPATAPDYGFTAPGGLVNGPWTVTYLGGDSFQIEDSGGAVIGTANFGSANYQNVFAEIGLDVGFDFSITGIPSIGDTFTIEYNSGGFNDNRNGLILAGLQTDTSTTRLNALSTPGGVNSASFNQTYGSMVSLIGERTNQARNSEAANEALLQQSQLWFESLSGVSLDEEAANLIRFQQTYQAATRILSTSQTIFDTLLAAVR
ncbi:MULTISPECIES: flagellar hook-associated protein FlgK [Alkalimonas]|uniref:Flagellar hook-associated protein 1 n=1 Tax=Alkalimonas mucilaginosa TaxID=3057676 RepID=A0ABU7JJF3_9GAMM|nr:flagellar hook-associated protein FlgK [Alkalimonas sp. MEB004]MEE2025832.1 flagellar hook-associated protein FlgK [Alkalimonas sp. MEB004]